MFIYKLRPSLCANQVQVHLTVRFRHIHKDFEQLISYVPDIATHAACINMQEIDACKVLCWNFGHRSGLHLNQLFVQRIQLVQRFGDTIEQPRMHDMHEKMKNISIMYWHNPCRHAWACTKMGEFNHAWYKVQTPWPEQS